MKDAVCKKCRRAMQKLFLKGERCYTAKCSMIKKPYPPGMHGKKRKNISEYGAQLLEKQKICEIYNLREKQLRGYLQKASKQKGVLGDNLLKKLETRLDNVIFRLGWGDSRRKTRQIVNHGHILVNNKKVDLPSFQVKSKDEIKIKEGSLKTPLFKDLQTKLKKHEIPTWLSLDKKKLVGKIISEPSAEKVNIPVDVHMIIEHYSR